MLLDRREWLRFGLGGIAGLTAAPSASARSSPGFGRAKRVLVVFTGGGVSQLDSFDPRPNAPVEIRGAFSSIPTRATGIRFSEHLPKLADRANRFHLIRSMTHDDLDHGSAIYQALTGRAHPRKSSNPPPAANDFPTAASIYRKVAPGQKLLFPSAHVNGPIMIPRSPGPGQNGGFLGHGSDPLLVGNPLEQAAFVRGLTLPEELPVARLTRRENLLQSLEGLARSSDRWTDDGDDLRRQAASLIQAQTFRAAFDLEREPHTVRERYGFDRAGQSCLLGRRLIEAGVPWVTVFLGHNIRGQDESNAPEEFGWDTHNDIFDTLRDHLLPGLDRSLSALLDDIDQRGLLEETLVICMGEFGRSPVVAKEARFAGVSPGRKHWGGCYSLLLTGAGIRPGAVTGAGDRIAAYPQEVPLKPADITATLFHALGIDPAGHFEDSSSRPWTISEGTPITRLW